MYINLILKFKNYPKNIFQPWIAFVTFLEKYFLLKIKFKKISNQAACNDVIDLVPLECPISP